MQIHEALQVTKESSLIDQADAIKAIVWYLASECPSESMIKEVENKIEELTT